MASPTWFRDTYELPQWELSTQIQALKTRYDTLELKFEKLHLDVLEVADDESLKVLTDLEHEKSEVWKSLWILRKKLSIISLEARDATLKNLPIELKSQQRIEYDYGCNLKVVGRGTYGKVIKCTDLRSGDFLALKTFMSNKQWRKEIEGMLLANQVSSSYITRFIFAGEKIVGTEWFGDVSLWEYLKIGRFDRNILSDPESKDLSVQIATGISDLQNYGLCHGDLSLGNIRFDGKRIKFIDLGSVSRIGVDMALCTYMFSHPETLKGNLATPNTDLWALGVIMLMFKGSEYYSLGTQFINEYNSPSENSKNMLEGIPWILEQVAQETNAGNFLYRFALSELLVDKPKPIKEIVELLR